MLYGDRSCDLCPQHHGHRRQDQRAGGGSGAAKGVSVEAARAEITEATAKQYLEDVTALGCLPPTHTPRATEHVAQMIAMIEQLDRGGSRLCGGRPCAVRCLVESRLRQAGAPLAGRNDGRRARRSRALQEEPDGFRVVEAVGRAHAGLGIALGPRPAGLAHRMLGDGRGAFSAKPSTFTAAASI